LACGCLSWFTSTFGFLSLELLILRPSFHEENFIDLLNPCIPTFCHVFSSYFQLFWVNLLFPVFFFQKPFLLVVFFFYEPLSDTFSFFGPTILLLFLRTFFDLPILFIIFCVLI